MSTDTGHIYSENNDTIINGEPITFKTGDVAKELNETTAMIRVYCNEFADFLELEHTDGGHRIFYRDQIEKLKFIIYLCKEKNLKVKQAREYLSTPEGKLMTPISDETDKTKVILNVLTEQIQTIIKNEVYEALKTYAPDLNKLTTIQDKLSEVAISTENNTKTLSEVKKESTNIKDTVNSINNKSTEISTSIESANSIAQERSHKVEELIMNFREQAAEKEAKTKKGFFSKLFGKE